MKILCVRHYQYLCDENSNGRPSKPRLPSNIFLAAAYMNSLGYEATVESLRNKEIATELLQDYDVVVVWVPLWEGMDLHIDYLRQAKLQGKKTIAVLNDPLADIEEEMLKTYDFIDIAIRLYEREIVLGKVMEALSHDINTDAFSFEGVIYRDKAGKVCDNGKMQALKDLNHLVSAAKFIKREKEENGFDVYDQAFVEVARGCPFQCDFCFYNSTGYRHRKISEIIDELKVLEGHFTHIWFHDLNMLVDKKFVHALCDEIIKQDIKVNWGTDGRIELCNDLDLLKKMREAGCYVLALGLESGSKRILKHFNKEKNIQHLDQALTNCSSANIIPSLNIMIGFPWENEEDLQKTKEFVMKYDIAFIQFVRPLRGTKLYAAYKAEGLIKEELPLSFYNNCRGTALFPTLHISTDRLNSFMKELSLSIAEKRFLKDINDICKGSKICIFGTGEAGVSFGRLVSEKRKDIEIVCFADTFKEGQCAGKEIYSIEKLLQSGAKVDVIYIAAQAHEVIAKNLYSFGISKYKEVHPSLYNEK